MNLSHIFLTLQRAIEEKSWTWTDVASGLLAGKKISTAFFGPTHRESLIKWAKMAYSTYKIYPRLTAVPFFQQHVTWIQPLKYTAFFISALNLQTVFFRHKSCVTTAFTGSVHPFRRFSAEIWDYTPSILAIANVGMIMIAFPKHPMKAAIGFTAAVITYVDIHHYLPEGMSTAWNASMWVSHLYLFYEAGWEKRGVIIIKLFLRYVLKLK